MCVILRHRDGHDVVMYCYVVSTFTQVSVTFTSLRWRNLEIRIINKLTRLRYLGERGMIHIMETEHD